jgi:hypothetical protein
MSACVRSAERARIGLSQCIVFVSDETRFAASAFQPLTFHSQSKEIFDGLRQLQFCSFGDRPETVRGSSAQSRIR